MQVHFLCWKDPLAEGMATHSSILAWRIPWTEEPGGIQSIGSQRVKHEWSDLACMFRQQVCFKGIGKQTGKPSSKMWSEKSRQEVHFSKKYNSNSIYKIKVRTLVCNRRKLFKKNLYLIEKDRKYSKINNDAISEQIREKN